MKNLLKLFMVGFLFLLTACPNKNPVVEEEDVFYTFTINNDNGTELITTRHKKGDVLSSPEEPTKLGAEFLGYLKDGEPFYFPYVIDKDISIIANWEITQEVYTLTLEYDITYERNPIGEYRLPIIERENYFFLGWYDNLEFTGEEYKFIYLTSDLHLYPKFALDIGTFDEDMFDLSNVPLNGDIELIYEVNGFTITYESSSNTLSPTGKFNKPFNEEEVILTAYITDGEITEEKTYTFNPIPYPKLVEGKIRSSYTRMFSGLSDKYFQSVDIINPSFATVNEHGYFKTPYYFSDVSTYILPKAREYGNRVMLVVGPGTDWTGMVNNGGTAFDKFIDNLLEKVVEVGFAGVDIDWEVPRGQTEAIWYVYLMKNLYTKLKELNPDYLLTSAIAGGMWQPQYYNLRDSGPYHDYINMMTYDMVNSGGGYQNALFPRSGYHNPTLRVGSVVNTCSIEESVAIYNNYGIPNSKIIVGVAFYGRNQMKKDDGTWMHAGYSTSYHNLKPQIESGQLIEYYDPVAQVPYAVNPEGTRFVSYDNRRSIYAKADFIKQNGLAGMMNWDQSHDKNFELIGYLSNSMK